ncbi:MAG: repair exonuclease family protein [Deltaproteobacteria bacterium]|nr:repair exonuclease family protein [Deltaproteobacteria bacterium]
MFKFIHAADVHLDSPLRGLSHYESAPAEAIRDACRRAFENLVNFAIEEKVAFVLLAGDLYDGDWKDYSTGIFLSKQVGRLGRENIPVFAVSGNHDAANRMTKALDAPSNLTILSPRKVETIKLDNLNVAIHGRSFGSQHENENMAKNFPAGRKGMFNIGLLHTSLDGREGHAVYAPCALNDLFSSGYQYWALGHVHKQEFVSRGPWVVFPGCVQGRHIRETGSKGCVLVSVEDNNVIDVAPASLDVIRWALCTIDLTDAREGKDILERVRKKIEDERSSSEGRPVAMRIILQGATKMSDALSARPEEWDQQIKALGAEVALDDLWIQKVDNRTTGKIDVSSVPEDSAYGRLLQDILSVPDDPSRIAGFDNMLADLRQKVPIEALSGDSLFSIDDDQTLKRLTAEAKRMLLGRLLTMESVQ